MYERLKMMLSLPMILLVVSAAPATRAEQVDLSTPMCPYPYFLKAAKCEANTGELDKLKTDPVGCTAAGGNIENGKCALAGAAPTPSCRSVAGGTQSIKGEKCVFDTKTETSASGDYVGDIFRIVAVPSDDRNRLGGPSGTRLKVLSQRPLGERDRMLTVLPVSESHAWKIFHDSPAGDTPKGSDAAREVKASDLIEYGARRNGWAYGALAIPYKYYAGDKSFGPGVSVGPYVGRRWGTPGSAYTVALAATIGNVKGEIRDTQDKITSTPDLMAYSIAGGAMWDISKAQGVKPFKLGVFVGVDSVSSDNVVKFKNNRKGWIALQIGFDFTDN